MVYQFLEEKVEDILWELKFYKGMDYEKIQEV